MRLDAPLISFGAPIVDNLGVIQPFPALSMLAGLCANALGYDHRDADKLQSLQQRIIYAARCDRPGKRLEDYQTVDLGQEFMLDKNTAWTTRGRIESRAGGTAKTGTHIRQRDYWVDSIHTVAISFADDVAENNSSALKPNANKPLHSQQTETPALQKIEEALKTPERPLFIGRKCCLPSGPLFLTRTEEDSPLSALCNHPRIPKNRSENGEKSKLSAWWMETVEQKIKNLKGDAPWIPTRSRLISVTDERDWINQLHGGSRLMRHGLIDPPYESNTESKDVQQAYTNQQEADND